MMLMISSNILFLLTLLLGTIHALSSSSFFLMWLGMELNMLSMIPIIMIFQKWSEPQASFIYLYAQATGSLLFLSSIIMEETKMNTNMWFSPPMIILFALLIKAGAAPFHFWVPLIMQQMSWVPCLIIATWQKLIPMFIISKILFFSYKTPSNMLVTIAMMGAIIGSLGGLNQTQLRPLMAFSSIQHMGWILMASNFSFTLSLFYLLLYVSSTIILFVKFIKTMMYSTMQNNSLFNNNYSEMTMLKITLMSITGLPPLVMFYPKMMTLIFMITNTLWFPSILMILCNTISLAYYLRIYLTLNILSKGYSSLFLSKSSSNFSYTFLLSMFLYSVPAIYFIIS